MRVTILAILLALAGCANTDGRSPRSFASYDGQRVSCGDGESAVTIRRTAFCVESDDLDEVFEVDDW